MLTAIRLRLTVYAFREACSRATVAPPSAWSVVYEVVYLKYKRTQINVLLIIELALGVYGRFSSCLVKTNRSILVTALI